MNRSLRTLLGASLALFFFLSAPATRAEALRGSAPRLLEGAGWSVLEVEGDEVPRGASSLESGTWWDLRPRPGAGKLVRSDPGTAWAGLPETIVAGSSFEARLAGQDGAVVRISGTAVAEGLALVPSGPRDVVLVRETIADGGASLLRYLFVGTRGEPVALLEGPAVAPGAPFVPKRALLLAETPEANNGMQIRYTDFHQSLAAGATGFLQYSVQATTALSALNPAWTTVAGMISIDQTNVPYPPDPGDPGSTQILPEVWDFTGLVRATIPYRTFNTTRNDAAGGPCLSACATANTGPNPPDGTWQSYLKIDAYAPGGAFFTRDVYELNDNDTGANPSIDVPYLAQDEMNTEDRTQVCFQQSAGGANRFLKFFRFTGADPASAVLGVGDTWTSGAWTECDPTHGLNLAAASVCGSSCWPGCSGPSPYARGMLGAGAGFRMTAVEDGWVKVPSGNYIPSLLLRQDTDLQAGLDFIVGICNLGTTRTYSYDYFWVNRKYGLLASVSSPDDPAFTMPPTDWSAVGNQTDGADFSWGPFPPVQTEALACLSGTLVRWSLPADGSNLNGEPGIADYGYVVSWGGLDDPEALADWATNANHTPLPGQPGYLAAPVGSVPTSTIVTGWAGSAIKATVTTALRYTDPDVHDQRTYRSAAFYKVVEDPARLAAGSFRVGEAVAPFVTRSGADLQLTWPAVAGAASYRIRVHDLATRAEIPCPAGLGCTPAGPSAVHAGAAASAQGYGYTVLAVDACGEASSN